MLLGSTPASARKRLMPSRRREFCHSADIPSPFSRRFNTDGEGEPVE